MPAANIFETLRERVQKSNAYTEYEKRAMYWFRDQSTELTSWQTRNGRLRYDDLKAQTFTKRLVPATASTIGQFYFFQYRPEYAKRLPYYDRFPFVLVIDRQGTDTFLGLNFHYLPYDLRARLFDAMYPEAKVDPKKPLRAKLEMTYDDLRSVSKYKAFQPCVRRYYTENLVTPLLQVGATDWDLALFLPVHQFAKASPEAVWSNSRQQIRRTR